MCLRMIRLILNNSCVPLLRTHVCQKVLTMSLMCLGVLKVMYICLECLLCITYGVCVETKQANCSFICIKVIEYFSCAYQPKLMLLKVGLNIF